MTLHRTRSAVAAALLSVLVLLTAAMPAPGADAPLLDAQRLSATADGVRVLVTGAAEDVTEAIAEFGGDVVGHLPLVGAVVADVPPAAVEELEGAPGVTGVTENAPVQLQTTDDGTQHPADSEGVYTLGADKLWKNGYDGSGVGIAVLDTGVTEVTDLAGRVRGGVDLTHEQDGQDNYGHGTPIASLAAGNGAASGGAYTGAAPGAHIVPVKIAGRDGATDITRVLVGLDWIARHADTYDIRVVNISLGATPVAVDLVDAAVQRLWDLGLVVVVAAGNDGPDSIGTPAANTHVITVGATRGQDTKRTADDVIAPWSSNGFDADGRAKPDLVAPGQSVVVAGAPGSWGYDTHPEGHLGNGYQRVSGTSFSTGLISGVAALVLDMHPDWTPDQVLGQLATSANAITGTHAPTPWLPKAVETTTPFAANADATDTTVEAMAALQELGPADPTTLLEMVGDEAAAIAYGTGWYGTGWYGTGWYGTGWYGTGWYGTGWYGTGWYGDAWHGTGWYDLSWHGTGWYGTGWYGTGWYGTGWYGSGWS